MSNPQWVKKRGENRIEEQISETSTAASSSLCIPHNLPLLACRSGSHKPPVFLFLRLKQNRMNTSLWAQIEISSSTLPMMRCSAAILVG